MPLPHLTNINILFLHGRRNEFLLPAFTISVCTFISFFFRARSFDVSTISLISIKRQNVSVSSLHNLLQFEVLTGDFWIINLLITIFG